MALVQAADVCEHEPEEAQVAPSFEAIYREHFGFVWRSAHRLGVTAEAIDDVVQDVFLVVHRKAKTLDPGASVRAWLFTILRRVARDRWRAAQRRVRAGIVPLDPKAPEARAVLPSPDDRLSHEEARALLYRLIETLDQTKREVFILSELEGLSAPEIAAALDQNLNTVYSRLRSARAEFEEALNRHRARVQRSEP